MCDSYHASKINKKQVDWGPGARLGRGVKKRPFNIGGTWVVALTKKVVTLYETMSHKVIDIYGWSMPAFTFKFAKMSLSEKKVLQKEAVAAALTKLVWLLLIFYLKIKIIQFNYLFFSQIIEHISKNYKWTNQITFCIIFFFLVEKEKNCQVDQSVSVNQLLGINCQWLKTKFLVCFLRIFLKFIRL